MESNRWTKEQSSGNFQATVDEEETNVMYNIVRYQLWPYVLTCDENYCTV